MISTIVGAYSWTDKNNVPRIKFTLAEDVEGAFGRPCTTISCKKDNFKTSSGVPIEFNEKIIGRKYLIDFGIFQDSEKGNSVKYPKSFDEVK